MSSHSKNDARIGGPQGNSCLPRMPVRGKERAALQHLVEDLPINTI